MNELNGVERIVCRWLEWLETPESDGWGAQTTRNINFGPSSIGVRCTVFFLVFAMNYNFFYAFEDFSRYMGRCMIGYVMFFVLHLLASYHFLVLEVDWHASLGPVVYVGIKRECDCTFLSDANWLEQ